MSNAGLLADAQNAGTIDDAAFDVLSGVDLGSENDTGVSIDDIHADEVIIVNALVDDSSSIAYNNNEQHVINGHNQLPDSLTAAKKVDNIIMMTTAMNCGLIGNYAPVEQAVRLDHTNYRAVGTTPLRDRMLEVLRRNVEKTQEFEDKGVQVRTITVIVTDGEDVGSRARPQDVHAVVQSLLAQEIHIIAAIGIDDGHTDFTQVFTEFGIPHRWILTPGNSPEEIRKAFDLVSQSAVTASQSADAFSQMAGGGFTT